MREIACRSASINRHRYQPGERFIPHERRFHRNLEDIYKNLSNLNLYIGLRRNQTLPGVENLISMTFLQVKNHRLPR